MPPRCTGRLPPLKVKKMYEAFFAEDRRIRMDKPKANHLFKAAETGHVSRLRELLASGLPVDTRGQDNKTALMLAAECGQAEAFQLLIGPAHCVNGVAMIRVVRIVIRTRPVIAHFCLQFTESDVRSRLSWMRSIAYSSAGTTWGRAMFILPPV